MQRETPSTQKRIQQKWRLQIGAEGPRIADAAVLPSNDVEILLQNDEASAFRGTRLQPGAHLARLSAQGALISLKTALSGESLHELRLHHDSREGTIITGSFAKSIALAAERQEARGDRDGFVARISGSHSWLRTFGGLARDEIFDLVIDERGLLAAGWAESSFRFAGTSLVAASAAGDAILLAYSLEGEEMWAKRYAGRGVDRATHLALRGQQILLGGTFANALPGTNPALSSRGGNDIFVLALTRSGESVWSQSLGSAGQDALLALTPSLWIARTEQAVAFEDEAAPAPNLVLRVDEAGQMLAHRRVGTAPGISACALSDRIHILHSGGPEPKALMVTDEAEYLGARSVPKTSVAIACNGARRCIVRGHDRKGAWLDYQKWALP